MALPSPLEVFRGERFPCVSLGDGRETASPGNGLGGPTSTRVSSHEDWSISTTPRLRPIRFPTTKGGDVLGIGIDWSESSTWWLWAAPAKA